MMDAPCRLCGRTDYPHTCASFSILNSRYFCPDGMRHQFRSNWPWRPRCERCGEKEKS